MIVMAFVADLICKPSRSWVAQDFRAAGAPADFSNSAGPPVAAQIPYVRRIRQLFLGFVDNGIPVDELRAKVPKYPMIDAWQLTGSISYGVTMTSHLSPR
jgi:hypothetical protein